MKLKQIYNNILVENLKLSDAFWSWFGNSKTVDGEGNPIPFYHGSTSTTKFSTFKVGKPIWFTPDKKYAKAFIAGAGGGELYHVFLKIENPLYVGKIDGMANKNAVEKLSELTDIDVNILFDILKSTRNKLNLFEITNSERFAKLVTDKGYDGLKAEEGGGRITTYAVFKANQIKSTKNKKWGIGTDDFTV